MLKRTAAIVALSLAIGTSSAWAEFRPDEKPVWGMLNDTAYTLNGGEWNIDLWGPVTYGIVDGLQVGSMFWVWFAQIPNVNAKWNFIPESDFFPALSVGGSYYSFSIKLSDDDSNSDADISVSWYTLSAHVSKQLSQNMYLSGAYIYNGLDSSASLSTEDSAILNLSGTASGSKAVVSLVTDMSKSARFSAEIAANIAEEVNFDAGAGFEWAMGDAFRLKVGVDVLLRESPFYIPFVDLHWRFK